MLSLELEKEIPIAFPAHSQTKGTESLEVEGCPAFTHLLKVLPVEKNSKSNNLPLISVLISSIASWTFLAEKLLDLSGSEINLLFKA